MVDLEESVLAGGSPVVVSAVAEEPVAMAVLLVVVTPAVAVLTRMAMVAEELPTMLEAIKTTALGQVLVREVSSLAWPINNKERICFYLLF